MNRIIVALLLGFAFLTLHMSCAQDGETEEAVVEVEADGAAEGEGGELTTTEEGGELTTGDESDTEQPDANGQKTLTLEDMKLWSSIDLDKNGKLTIAEFDRFVRSPSARAFVNRMKSEKAVKAWADKIGIDVAKAKQAINMGARAQQQKNMMARQNVMRRRQLMQRNAVQQKRMARARQNNYFANLGKQYYKAAMRGGRRDEL